MKKEIVKKEISINKSFSYSSGACNLSFVLALNEKELSDFKNCLLEAVSDINQTIKSL